MFQFAHINIATIENYGQTFQSQHPISDPDKIIIRAPFSITLHTRIVSLEIYNGNTNLQCCTFIAYPNIGIR